MSHKIALAALATALVVGGPVASAFAEPSQELLTPSVQAVTTPQTGVDRALSANAAAAAAHEILMQDQSGHGGSGTAD